MDVVNMIQKKYTDIQNTKSKIVHDSINNFYFDDENGILIEKSNGYESYTFKVVKEVTFTFELENIVFSKNGNEFDVTLVKYELTPTEVQKIQNNIIFDTTTKPEIEALGRVMACNTRIDRCIRGIDAEGNSFFIVTFLDPCEGSGGSSVTGSGTGSSGDSGNGNSGYQGLEPISNSTGVSWGGGGSSENGTLLTVAVGSGATGAALNPCKKFKKQKEELPALNQALINLEATKTQNHENGIFVDSNSPNVQNLPASTAQGAAVGVPATSNGVKYKVLAHTHDAVGPNGTGTYSIFSWADLSLVADLIRTEQMQDDIFTIYPASADNTRYALTIDWPSAFSDYFDVRTNPNDPSQTNFFNSEKYIKLSEKNDEYYNDDSAVGSGKIGLATNPADDLIIFLKMLKDLKLDASIFEVDPTYTVFTKLTLNSNGTAVVPKAPCN